MAYNHIDGLFGITAKSKIWITAPIGSKGPDFLNAAVLIQTTKSIQELKQTLKQVEMKLGRIRTQDKFAPRTIDLDILTFNSLPNDSNLFTQAFAAVPAAELIPDFVDPVTNSSLITIAARLMRTTKIRPCSDCLT